jgi:hypothetical protein
MRSRCGKGLCMRPHHGGKFVCDRALDEGLLCDRTLEKKFVCDRTLKEDLVCNRTVEGGL